MSRSILSACAVALILGTPLLGLADEKGWPAEFYRAHYLATVENNPAAAAKLYEQLADDASLTAEQRETVRSRLKDAQERIVSQDLARLCPAETLGFIQLHQPGALIERLTSMLGIETKPIGPLLAQRRPGEKAESSHGDFKWVMPDEIAISPALMHWFKAFSGAAVAVTALHPHGEGDFEPDGLIILDAGDTELLKGLTETAAQFLPPADPIGGYPALQLPEGVTAALTERLIIAGRPRADVEAAVARIKGDAAGSLSNSKAFKKLMKGKEGATLFAYVDAQRALAVAKPFVEKDEEFQMARSLVDFDHLLGAALAIGAIDTGLGLDFSIALDENHHNLIYNLIRTPPMSRRTLACVPQKAAVVLGIGLNPADENTKPGTNGRAAALKSVTGLDIFRELFGNIQEVTLYAAPIEGGLLGGSENLPKAFIPNGAVIIAARDPEKSRALWTQLLTLPSIIMGEKVAKPKETEIGGQQATAFSIPDFGSVYVAQVNDCLVVAPRKEAMSAVIKAASGGKSVLTDPAVKPVLDRMHSDVGLMFLVHAGRALKTGAAIAGAHGGGMPPAMMNMMTGTALSSLDSTIVYLGFAPGETELNLRVCLAGLPNVNKLLKQFGPVMRMALDQRESLRHVRRTHRDRAVAQNRRESPRTIREENERPSNMEASPDPDRGDSPRDDDR